MSKNVIVNGKTHNGISFLELLTTEGVPALFKDIDEVSSGAGMTGLAEVASGTFTVGAQTMGGTETANSPLPVKHGMSGRPDGFAVIPKYFYDTMDNNIFGEVYTGAFNITGGRRSVASATMHVQANPDTTLANDTNIYPSGIAFAQFQPTYKDSDGNEGQQEYIWIAWRIAE